MKVDNVRPLPLNTRQWVIQGFNALRVFEELAIITNLLNINLNKGN